MNGLIFARTVGGNAPSWKSASAITLVCRNHELANFALFHAQTSLVPTWKAVSERRLRNEH